MARLGEEAVQQLVNMSAPSDPAMCGVDEEVRELLGQPYHSHHNCVVVATRDWLLENFEIVPDSCLAKVAVFSAYVQAWEMRKDQKPLCMTHFSRLIFALFPQISTRRIGARGAVQRHFCNLALKLTSPLLVSQCRPSRSTKLKKSSAGPRIHRSDAESSSSSDATNEALAVSDLGGPLRRSASEVYDEHLAHVAIKREHDYVDSSSDQLPRKYAELSQAVNRLAQESHGQLQSSAEPASLDLVYSDEDSLAHTSCGCDHHTLEPAPRAGDIMNAVQMAPCFGHPLEEGCQEAERFSLWEPSNQSVWDMSYFID